MKYSKSQPAVRTSSSELTTLASVGVHVRMTGLILGMAAAAPGVDIVRLGPFRIWHILVILSFAQIIYKRGLPAIASYKPGMIDLSFIAYISASIYFELYNSSTLQFAPAYGFILAPVFYYIAYVVCRMAILTANDAVEFLKFFVIFSVPSALIALGQIVSPSFGLLTVELASGDGLERRLNGMGLVRGAGLFGHWTGAGFYFCALAAASIALLSFSNRTRQSNRIGLVALISCVIGAMTTLTYSVIATMGVLTIIFLLKASRKVPAIIFIAAMGAGSFWLLSDELSDRIEEQATGGTSSWLPEWVPSTLRYRFAVWETQTIPAINERPSTGWGSEVLTDDSITRVIPSSIIWSSAESQWFYLALALGWIAVGMLCILLYMVWRKLRESSKHTSGATQVFVVLLAMAILSSFTVPVFTNRGFPLPFWILVGIAVATLRFRKVKNEVMMENVPYDNISRSK